MKKYKRVRTLACVFAASLLGVPASAAKQTDVVIYGGTPGGLAAAEAVVREGLHVIVIEPTSHIGGMVTGGIAITDTGTPQFVGGIASEFFDEVAAATKRPEDSGPPPLLFRGNKLPWNKVKSWDLEPKNARHVFERWVTRAGYELILNKRVRQVNTSRATIVSLELEEGTQISGKVFIDASYEGDLMAKAGVSHTYGREAASAYGEDLAGVREPHFIKNYSPQTYQTPGIEYMHHGQFGADIPARDSHGALLWGIQATPLGAVGSEDKRIQAYCYRLIATQRPGLKAAWPKPHHYDSGHYQLLLLYIQAHPGISFARLVHLGAIPNGKFDLNASGPFSIDFIAGNEGYPEATYAERDRMLQQHLDYEQGFLWFLAHDPRVPKELREETNSWGLANDEWTDTHNWPTQIYVRESRRMIGQYVMTQADVLHDKRKNDSAGMGSFVLDSHWVRRVVNPDGFVRVEGHLDESINLADHPYEIPYRSIVPQEKECRNLLVPVCVSATHVAICTIRMEPVYMILGHSAGVAAAMAIHSGRAVQEIDMSAWTKKLVAQKQVLHIEQRRF